MDMTRQPKRDRVVTTTNPAGLSAGPRAAIYNRVSTDDQDPTLALADLRRATVQRGYEVALEVAEHGSGKRSDRPGLQQVLAAARRGEIAVVVVARLDRFSRSMIDLLANVKTLNDAGCRFICTEQSIDIGPTGDPMSQLTLGILAAVAQFESGIITERVRDGVRRARERGVKFGRPRAEAPTADAIRALRAQQRSWSEIAGELGCTVGMARRRAVG